MKQNKSSHHSMSNSLNKHLFSKNYNNSSNLSTTKRIYETNKNKSSSKNILEMIYDDEFVIMINQLSTSIKNYYRANNKNFATIKTILKNNDINSLVISETFYKIENTFTLFYSSAKQIFKSMKIYRREKIANIMAQHKKKNSGHINNLNNMNINPKQRNSDAKIKQLIKGENDLSNNLLHNNSSKTYSINITQQNINNNINSSVNISNFMVNPSNKNNSSNNLNNNSNINDSEFSSLYIHEHDKNNKNINNNISEFIIDNTEDTNNDNYDPYFDPIKNVNRKRFF